MNRNESVLVVDRASMVAETVAMALELAGYEAREATSFRDARRLFRELPDLTLLIAHADTPGQPFGGRLLSMAVNERPRLPIVVISSRSASELPPLPPNAVFLRKPFDKQALMDAIDSAHALQRAAR
jgi:DNA-binding NtrC family response regulator